MGHEGALEHVTQPGEVPGWADVAGLPGDSAEGPLVLGPEVWVGSKVESVAVHSGRKLGADEGEGDKVKGWSRSTRAPVPPEGRLFRERPGRVLRE